MKFNKRMISLLLAVLLIFNSTPIGHASRGQELTVSERISDFVTDVEFGWNGGSYQFADGVLVGVEEGDEVYLVADASVTDINGLPQVGDEITVEFENFKITGKDAEYYILPDLTGMTASATIKVLRKTLLIRPATTSAYYGQPLPDNGKVSVSEDYKKQLVSENDDVSVSCEFFFDLGDSTEPGTYALVKVGEIELKGEDAPYYIAEVEDQENLTFSINDYETTAVASDGNAEGNYGNQNGKTKAVLKAPEGFLISATGELDDDVWTESIEVTLNETGVDENGVAETDSCVYYLRNNAGGEEHLAVCEKIYTYTAMPLPTVTGIELVAGKREETADGIVPTTIHYEDNGVFADGSVQAVVYVTGASYEQATDITLSVSGAETTVTATDVTLEDGRYTYKAVFDITVSDGEGVSHVLYAYAKNSSGTGETYPAEGCEDTYLDSDTPVTMPLVLDRKAPDAVVNSIEPGVGVVTGSFTVTDVHSGIVKVEYAWGNDEGPYEEYKVYNKYDKDYPAEVKGAVSLYSWNSGYYQAPGGKHTLYLRATDALGNETLYHWKDDSNPGSDNKAPVINSVEIKVAEGTALDDSQTEGIFANGPVEIWIKAEDVKDQNSEAYGLGEDAVTLTANDRKATYTAKKYVIKENEEDVTYFVVNVSPDTKLSDIYIQVKDKAQNSTDLIELTAIPKPDGTTNYLSNDLYVENDGPAIKYTSDELGSLYSGSSCYWFGIKDNEESITFSVQDYISNKNEKDYKISAGLKSILVTETIKTEDGETKTEYMNETFVFNEHTSASISIPLNQFGQGEHTIDVTVQDYCGNVNTIPFTFNKDTSKPESGTIAPTNDAKTYIKEWTNSSNESVNWVSKENTDEISFRIASTDGDKLSKIVVWVNGNEQTYQINAGKTMYEIETDENGNSYITIDISDFEMSTPDMEKNYDPEYNCYAISATLYDMAQNRVDRDYMLYVDTSNPWIQQITVDNKEGSMLREVLNILTFGIFSRDTLIFRVKAFDGAGDSGVGDVTMYLTADGESTENQIAKEMLLDDEGYYSVEVTEAELTKMGKTLSFTVADEFGKTCETFPLIPNEKEDGKEEEDGVFVMIETEIPVVEVSFPNADGFARSDDQIWFKSYKDITVTLQDPDSGVSKVEFLVNNIPVSEAVDADGEKVKLISDPDAKLNGEYVYTFNTKDLMEIAGETEDGAYKLNLRVTDNSGNVFRWNKTFFVDEAAPVINKISFSTATADDIEETADFVETPKYSFFFDQDFDTTAHVSDEGPSSGIYQVRYWLGSAEGEAKIATMNGNGEAFVDVPNDFKGKIYYKVLDYAGNSSSVLTTDAYVVDKASPDIKITPNETTPYRDAENNPLYTTSNSFTVVITDTVSGLKSVSYTKDAELNPAEKKTIAIGDNADVVGDGWEITGTDGNLITQVRKTFTFGDNDNDICMHFSAMDRSENKNENVDSEVFTIDTIDPKILVNFGPDNDDDPYYNENRVATITVTERNFSADLIQVMIENHFGSVPGCSFTSVSKTEHIATINFDEGDYTFDIAGQDLCGHNAVVTFTGGNEKLFYVDKTMPLITENFHEFANDQENSFSVDKTARITIVEHNFDADLTNLRITRKAAGGEHSHNGMVDVTKEVLGGRGWTRNGDTYTIEFTFSTDAVYYVEIAPVDLASNQGAKRNTVVFEIDKTVPVVSAKNGEAVSPEDTELLDVYPYDRRDSAAPTVEFTDNNIDHIEYTLITYIPEYLSDGSVRVDPVVESGIVKGSLFTLENFDQDGIYSVELVAVDVAGNRSEVNSNTYARMVDQDVLAFILDSNVKEQTGLFSLEYENGEAISKKPYDFKDLQILVMSPVEMPVDIVLRDTNGKEIKVASNLISAESVYGVNVHTFEISADFFRENFQDDIETEMHLTVWNQEYRIDLARIHIDNIAPDCDFPQELYSWAWFAGEEDRTFAITNISELLAVADCKVYDNGVEIPFEYSSEEDTLTFTLSKGWHNIGFILCDAAGNANINQEMNNIHIGNFWTIFGAALGTIAVTGLIVLLLYRRKRAVQEMQEEA